MRSLVVFNSNTSAGELNLLAHRHGGGTENALQNMEFWSQPLKLSVPLALSKKVIALRFM